MAGNIFMGRKILASLALMGATMCTAQAADAVTVGSKIDTEGSLLGNLIVQTLDANGIKTVNKTQLGTTKVYGVRSPRAKLIFTQNIPAMGLSSLPTKKIQHGKMLSKAMKSEAARFGEEPNCLVDASTG